MYLANATIDLALPQFLHLLSGDAAPHVGGLKVQLLVLRCKHSSRLVDIPIIFL